MGERRGGNSSGGREGEEGGIFKSDYNVFECGRGQLPVLNTYIY